MATGAEGAGIVVTVHGLRIGPCERLDAPGSPGYPIVGPLMGLQHQRRPDDGPAPGAGLARA